MAIQKAAVGATQLGVKQYETGTIAFSTVFQLETAQVQQQDQLALAQGNAAVNLIDTYRALGGGWEIRCQRSNGGVAQSDQPLAAEQVPAPGAPQPPPQSP